MMRRSCALALVLALGFTFSSEGFRLKVREESVASELVQQRAAGVGGISVSGGAWKALRYSFRITPDGLNYVEFARPIFKSPKSAYDVLPSEHVSTDEIITEGVQDKAENVALGVDAKGNYLAFSASASINMEKMNTNKFQTVMMEKWVRAYKYKVSAKKFQLHEELTASAKQALKTWSFDKIVNDIGEFYATEMELGGEFRTTHVMDKASGESKNSLKTEFEASYGDAVVAAVELKSQGEMVETTTYENSKMRTLWQVWGGSATTWLQLNENIANEIQQKWADSVEDSNLYPVGVHLVPIWELLAPLDKTRASNLKKFLQKKWKQEAKAVPSYPPVPLPGWER
jgi:hypothetical protein